MGLTAFGMATMWGAIAADVGVSLLVVANALRLLSGHKAKAPPSGGEPVDVQMVKGTLLHER